MNGGAVGRAFSELKLADHMIYMTLPLLNDRMIFLNAVTHVHKAIMLVINAFIKKEFDYKRIDFMPPEDERASVFIRDYSSRLGVKVYSTVITKIDSFVKVKNRSSVKLQRGDKFVLITPEYETVSINENEIKGYIKKIEEFLNKMKVKLDER